MTTIEEDKALVRRFVELENRGDLEALFGLLSPGYVSHYSTGDSTLEDTTPIAIPTSREQEEWRKDAIPYSKEFLF